MIKLAALNLFRNKRRLLTGVGGVALAVAVILLIEGFAVGMFLQTTAYVEKNGAEIYLGQKGVESLQSVVSLLPRAVESDIAATEGVREVTSIYALPIILEVGERKTPVTLYGFRPGSGMGGPWKLAEGRMLAGDDEVILDRVLAEQNGLEVGERVRILGKEFLLAGLSAETNAYMNASVFLTQAAVAERLGARDLVSFFLIKAENADQIDALKDRLAERFPDLTVLTRPEMADNTSSQFEEVLGRPLNVILGVAFLVGLMVVGLTTHMVVLEKLREYGVLKAVGAGNRHLYAIVLVESLYWTALGYGAGVLLSQTAARLIMQWSPQFFIAFGSASLSKAAAMTAVMSLVTTISPIRRVGKLDPARVFN